MIYKTSSRLFVAVKAKLTYSCLIFRSRFKEEPFICHWFDYITCEKQKLRKLLDRNFLGLEILNDQQIIFERFYPCSYSLDHWWSDKLFACHYCLQLVLLILSSALIPASFFIWIPNFDVIFLSSAALCYDVTVKCMRIVWNDIMSSASTLCQKQCWEVAILHQ